MFDLQEMKQRLGALDAEREQLIPLIKAAEAYEAVRGKAVIDRTGLVVRHRSRPTDAQRSRAAPVMEATEQTVVRLVELNGNQPVSTAEVVADMVDRGLPVPDRNPNNVISARLSNSVKIKGKRGFGWLPVGVPFPGEDNQMFVDAENPEADGPRAKSTTVEGREPDPRSVVDRCSGPERQVVHDNMTD